MKSVLPAVCPHLAYDDLEIQDMASLQFYRMIFEVIDEKERRRIKDALLKYCGRDTLAMVALKKGLGSRAKSEADKGWVIERLLCPAPMRLLVQKHQQRINELVAKFPLIHDNYL